MGERDAFQSGSYFSVVLILSSIYVSIQAQSIPGFLSIDCGSAPHNDAITKILWEGDGQYTSTGMSGKVPFVVNSTLDNSEALQTFRYFPERRNKHCYDLPTTTGNISFLLRAMFLHGSSAELTLPIQFDVAVNGTLAFSVHYNIADSYETLSTPKVWEAIFYSPGTLTHFCLVPGTGVPFISSLELRQFDPDGLMYAFDNSTAKYLTNLRRWNSGAQSGSPTVRYPDDSFDRLWYAPGAWSRSIISSTGTVDSNTDSDVNSVPPKVMQDAWLDGSVFWVSFSPASWVSEVYIAMYFEEIESSASQGDRIFDIEISGDSVATRETPPEGYVELRSWWDYAVFGSDLNFSFTAVNNSKLGPILNAIEVYAQIGFNDSATAAQDVDVLAALQVSFNLTEWHGDPCYPVSWDWVSCTGDTTARVDKLLLSSMGIDSAIPPTISDLSALTEIHLDNNSLYGTIPASLASLPQLTFLFLNDNDLSGEVPPALVTKLGSKFFYSGNKLLGNSSSKSATKKKSTSIGVIIGAIAGGLAAIAILVGILICYCSSKRKKVQSNYLDKVEMGIAANQATSRPSSHIDGATPQPPFAKKFTVVGQVPYETVQAATNNFNAKIGQGSYGSVYHGWLNNREVAVKLNNIQSHQGHQEFITEVDILTRVHHRNLVSLIGYCDEGKELILIYEFEVNGTLLEWLQDEGKIRGTLDWKKRLQIAADAAKGLEYLHKGCDPTIIHRDVKSNNILLDDSMTAKVADFGLSKATNCENTSGFTTGVKGTPGYLDPEYYQLGRLTHKSDVYSYGVVLAEIITGRLPVKAQSGGNPLLLVEFVRKLVDRNDIETLADPNLQGAYNPESMWKIADVVLSCIDPVGARRPDFTQVVNGITEAIELEKSFAIHSEPSRSFILPSSGNLRYQSLY